MDNTLKLIKSSLIKIFQLGPYLGFACNFSFFQIPYFGYQITKWVCKAQGTLTSELPFQLGSRVSQSSVEHLK